MDFTADEWNPQAVPWILLVSALDFTLRFYLIPSKISG